MAHPTRPQVDPAADELLTAAEPSLGCTPPGSPGSPGPGRQRRGSRICGAAAGYGPGRRRAIGRGRGGGGARLAVLAAGVLAAAVASVRADQTLTFDGAVPPDGPDHFYIPFQVPDGVRELEVHHDNQSAVNILDWGLLDPSGYRGWGGGTRENALVNESAASRAYVPGPLTPGAWRVVVGKAKIVQSPASYHVEITLREQPHLAAQPQRTAYAAVAALRKERRYYAGDLHAHSLESTDARPTLDEMARLARRRGLDFLVVSDHNTVTQLDFFAQVQRQYPDLLLVPGIEVTTYAGHAGAIGATRFVEHKVGLAVPSFAEVAAAVHGQGALLSLNHPVLDLGDVCIGCAWQHSLAGIEVDAVEIGTGGLEEGAILFSAGAIKFWERLLGQGRHVAAVGGSDDHLAGQGTGRRDSPIGDPTTLILAEELSVAALLDGLRHGRSVVKLQGPADPMVELSAGAAVLGDTVAGRSAVLTARVTGGQGGSLRFVKNGEPDEAVVIDADPFVLTRDVLAPGSPAGTAEPAGPPLEDRWRVEVLLDNQPRTVSSHLYLRRDPLGPDPVGDRDRPTGGCTASPTPLGSRPLAAGSVAALLALRALRRALRVRAARRAVPI